MKINEIFYSLQGEGARAGDPSIFIRFAGCDLACAFCDTEFESGKEMSIMDVHNVIKEYPCRWIVWTGGEPALQLTSEIVLEFKRLGYKQAIETNGNHIVPDGLDWVACSPKVADHVVFRNFPNGVDELRYVRHSGQPGIPKPTIKAKRYFLSPMFRANQVDNNNLIHCISLCLSNPSWSLSVQTHKMTKTL